LTFAVFASVRAVGRACARRRSRRSDRSERSSVALARVASGEEEGDEAKDRSASSALPSLRIASAKPKKRFGFA
jgi:hypothetical protein